MAVFRNDGVYDASNAEFDGVRIVAYDKLHCRSAVDHIDYALAAFERSVFTAIPREGSVTLTDLPGLLRTGNLSAYEVHQRFHEIGSAAGLRETSEFLARGQQSVSD